MPTSIILTWLRWLHTSQNQLLNLRLCTLLAFRIKVPALARAS